MSAWYIANILISTILGHKCKQFSQNSKKIVELSSTEIHHITSIQFYYNIIKSSVIESSKFNLQNLTFKYLSLEI